MTPRPPDAAPRDRLAQTSGRVGTGRSGKPVSSPFPPAFQSRFFPMFQGDARGQGKERANGAFRRRTHGRAPDARRACVEVVAGIVSAATRAGDLTFAGPSLYIVLGRPVPPTQEPRR